MIWELAVEAMRLGHVVRRTSNMNKRRLYKEATETSLAIYTDEGTEAICLLHAWTDQDKPVMIFAGEGSKCLFVPESDDREASDWIVIS